MTELKEVEREKRVNEAQRNLRLAEAKVALCEKKVKEIEQNEDAESVHGAANLRMVSIKLDHAKADLEDAKQALIEAEIDPETLDKVMELLPIVGCLQ